MPQLNKLYSKTRSIESKSRSHGLVPGPCWAVLLLTLAVSWPAMGHAGDLTGSWQASRMGVQWLSGHWPPECGAKPSGGSSPASRVTIKHTARELSITGGGRSYRTTTCWEQRPGLSRVSHSAGASNWSTTCKSIKPTEQIIIRTTISASGARIHFDETGQYRVTVNGQSCTASSRKTRTYRLLESHATSPRPTSPSPAEPAQQAPRLDTERKGFDFGGATKRSSPAPTPAQAQRGAKSVPPSAAPSVSYSSLLASPESGLATSDSDPAVASRVVSAGTAIGPNSGLKGKQAFLLVALLLSAALGGLGVYQLRQAKKRNMRRL